MAEWDRNKVNPSDINGGKQFTADDNLAINELNSMVNNSFYAVDFAEAMADAPDISEIAGDGTPSVSLVSNGKFKKFKFSNLKGAKGEQGIQGAKGEKGDKGDTVPNTLTIGNVSSGETPSATITGTAPNQVLNLVLPKGEKGDKGDTGVAGDNLLEAYVLGTFSDTKTTISFNGNNYRYFVFVRDTSPTYGTYYQYSGAKFLYNRIYEADERSQVKYDGVCFYEEYRLTDNNDKIFKEEHIANFVYDRTDTGGKLSYSKCYRYNYILPQVSISTGGNISLSRTSWSCYIKVYGIK